MDELKQALRMVREDVASNPPSVEISPGLSLITVDDLSEYPLPPPPTVIHPPAENTGEVITNDIVNFVYDMYNNDQSFEHDTIPSPVPVYTQLAEKTGTLSRSELKQSLALYRQELLKVQEAAEFAKREKPVANINAHNAATSKTAKKLTAKQIKSKQVTNMKKVGLLAGLFKQAS